MALLTGGGIAAIHDTMRDGLDHEQLARVDEAAALVPIVYDRNMSLGVAVLARLVREAAATLGMDFAVDVSEVHHVHKKDAPSGTALKLGEVVAAARGEDGTGSIEFRSEPMDFPLGAGQQLCRAGGLLFDRYRCAFRGDPDLFFRWRLTGDDAFWFLRGRSRRW